MKPLASRKSGRNFEPAVKLSHSQNTNQNKNGFKLNTSGISSELPLYSKNNSSQETKSQNTSPNFRMINSHGSLNRPKDALRVITAEGRGAKVQLLSDPANNDTFDSQGTKIRSPYSISLVAKPQRRFKRVGSEEISEYHFSSLGLKDSEPDSKMKSKNLNSFNLDIVKEKEELRNAIRDEWAKYQAEKQDFEKLLQESTKNKLRTSNKNLRKYSESPMPHQNTTNKPLINNIPSFSPVNKGNNTNVSAKQGALTERTREKNQNAASHLQTSLASLSPRNSDVSQSDPTIQHDFPNKIVEADEHRSPSKTVTIVDNNPLKSQQNQGKSNKLETFPAAARKNTSRLTGKVARSRNDLDKSPSYQHLYDRSTFEDQSSFQKDKREFKSIRETLWEEEKNDEITKKNVKRIEKLMEMNIGKFLDEMTRDLLKCKKMRRNNKQLIQQSAGKSVRYVEDAFHG